MTLTSGRTVPTWIWAVLVLAAGAPALAQVACPPGSTTPEVFADWYQRALQIDADLYPPAPGGAPRPLPQELIDASLAALCDCGAPAASCVEDEHTLCLGRGRFEVRASWELAGGHQGEGRQVRLSEDTGYFWFFGDSNVELVVKVLDGCAVADRYWVFAGGLTNVRVVITVRDTVAEQTKTYVNPQSTAFRPIQDTAAFATCP